MHHLPRRKGSDLGLLTETAIETETGSLPHLKTGNGIVQGIGVEESAVLAPVPDPSLRKGKVTCCVLPGKGVYISDSFILGSSDASIWGHESVIGFSTPGDPVSLVFNMLSRLVIMFLPRSKHLLISWMQSPSSVILEPKKIKSATVSTLFPSICYEVMGLDALVFVF